MIADTPSPTTASWKWDNKHRNVQKEYRISGVGRDERKWPSTLCCPIGPDIPFRPSGFYGASKAFAEILGRVYSDQHGLSVLCIRIVQANQENRPHSPRWIRHSDVEQMLRKCIEAKDLPYGVYYGVSDNRNAIWDISNAERDLGYRPIDGIR